MPAATDEQVPKPLTYALMYHGLWLAMFVLTALGLMALFIASGVAVPRSLIAPWPLVALALLAGAGFFITYAVRLQILLGEFDRPEAFRWSEASSWAVLAVAPVIWLGWVWAEPFVQRWITGSQSWAPPEGIVSSTVKVEVVVWWLSHLLSVRGLARGRRTYLVGAETAAPRSVGADGITASDATPGALPGANGPASGAAAASAATLASAGDRRA